MSSAPAFDERRIPVGNTGNPHVTTKPELGVLDFRGPEGGQDAPTSSCVHSTDFQPHLEKWQSASGSPIVSSFA